jgi:hypothetical protein
MAAWWQKLQERKPPDRTGGRSAIAERLRAADPDPDLPPYDPSEWQMPFADASWTGDEPPPARPGRPMFTFDDRGLPGGRSWRSAGWWVRAEPTPVRAAIAAAAKPVPTLMRAWTFTAPARQPAPPRGDERLALLWEWGSAFAAV